MGWQNELGRGLEYWIGRPPLIGDSLDWRKDTARLSDWISRHALEGTTIVSVYGLGTGDPYGLAPPNARSVTDPGERPSFMAVSANILYGYEAADCVRLGNQRSYLTDSQRALLLIQTPLTRIGRTILIYSLDGVLPDRGLDTEAF